MNIRQHYCSKNKCYLEVSNRVVRHESVHDVVERVQDKVAHQEEDKGQVAKLAPRRQASGRHVVQDGRSAAVAATTLHVTPFLAATWDGVAVDVRAAVA